MDSLKEALHKGNWKLNNKIIKNLVELEIIIIK